MLHIRCFIFRGFPLPESDEALVLTRVGLIQDKLLRLSKNTHDLVSSCPLSSFLPLILFSPLSSFCCTRIALTFFGWRCAISGRGWAQTPTIGKFVPVFSVLTSHITHSLSSFCSVSKNNTRIFFDRDARSEEEVRYKRPQLGKFVPVFTVLTSHIIRSSSSFCSYNMNNARIFQMELHDQEEGSYTDAHNSVSPCLFTLF
jgi:hypothetical protein